MAQDRFAQLWQLAQTLYRRGDVRRVPQIQKSPLPPRGGVGCAGLGWDGVGVLGKESRGGEESSVREVIVSSHSVEVMTARKQTVRVSNHTVKTSTRHRQGAG